MGKKPPFRPLQPGEFIKNPDGSVSTEVTVTVDDGNGGWMVIPQLYMGPQGVIDLRDKGEAAAYAARMLRDQYGMTFPTFPTVQDADTWAQRRSEKGGAGQGSINGLLSEE